MLKKKKNKKKIKRYKFLFERYFYLSIKYETIYENKHKELQRLLDSLSNYEILKIIKYKKNLNKDKKNRIKIFDSYGIFNKHIGKKNSKKIVKK